MFMLQNI